MSDVSGQQLALEYERGDGSWRDICAKYGLNVSTAQSRARPYRKTDGRKPMGVSTAQPEQTPQPSPAPTSVEPTPSGDVEVRDRDVVRMDTTRTKPAATYIIADMQLGEREFLLSCWDSVNAAAAERIGAAGPGTVRLVINGDAITGSGVFRSQEQRVLLPTTDPQTAYGALKLAEVVERLEQASGVEPEVIVVRGNHDVDRGAGDKAYELVIGLHLLGVKARYAGKRALVNLAPEGCEQYVHMVEHMFGNSSYYPVSYAAIRAIKDYLIQSGAWGRVEDGVIRRVCTGHTHWLNVGLDLAGVPCDTCGGWTRPERHGLGGAVRAVGGLLYIHNGAELVVETVKPTTGDIRAATDDPFLHETNMSDIATGIREMKERFIDMGLVATEGVL